jgi:hypothetical protein
MNFYYVVSRSGLKSTYCLLFFLILAFYPEMLKSQDSIPALDRVYGPDQTLYNGMKYRYTPPPASGGNQYLLSGAYFTGSVTLKDKTYPEISLNYDLFNQQLLFLFNDESGAMNIIEVSKAWIKGFRLDNRNFEYLRLQEEPQFYQVLGEGSLRFLYFWHKELSLEATVGTHAYSFTGPERDLYLLSEGKIKAFSNNRNLLKLFDPEHRPEIKGYMHKNKINVKKASDPVMEALISFIGRLK